MNKKSRGRLNVERVLADFRKSEESSAHRNGTFKINTPFNQALETILKNKPKKPRRKANV